MSLIYSKVKLAFSTFRALHGENMTSNSRVQVYKHVTNLCDFWSWKCKREAHSLHNMRASGHTRNKRTGVCLVLRGGPSAAAAAGPRADGKVGAVERISRGEWRRERASDERTVQCQARSRPSEERVAESVVRPHVCFECVWQNKNNREIKRRACSVWSRVRKICMLGPLESLLEDWDLDVNLELTVTREMQAAADGSHHQQQAKRPQLHRYLSEGHEVVHGAPPVRRSATMNFVKPPKPKRSNRLVINNKIVYK